MFSTASQVVDVDAKVTDIHNHLVSILLIMIAMYTDILIDDFF